MGEPQANQQLWQSMRQQRMSCSTDKYGRRFFSFLMAPQQTIIRGPQKKLLRWPMPKKWLRGRRRRVHFHFNVASFFGGNFKASHVNFGFTSINFGIIASLRGGGQFKTLVFNKFRRYSAIVNDFFYQIIIFLLTCFGIRS